MTLYRSFPNPIHKAVCLGNIEEVEKAVRDHKDKINHFDHNGYLPIHIAVQKNYLDITKLLIEQGADLELPVYNQRKININNIDSKIQINKAPYEFDYVPDTDIIIKGLTIDKGLIKSCYYNELRVKKFDDEAEFGFSYPVLFDRFAPLHIATFNNNLAMVELLIDKGAEVDSYTANSRGYIETDKHEIYIDEATQLLSYFEDGPPEGYTQSEVWSSKDEVPIWGFTPLHLAAQKNHSDILSLLIKKTEDINLSADLPCDNQDHCIQFSALGLAARAGHLKSVQLLLNNGAKDGSNAFFDGNVEGYVNTALCHAFAQTRYPCDSGEQELIIKEILDRGDPQVNAKLCYGDTHMDFSTPVLIQAIKNGSDATVEKLLALKADPNCPESSLMHEGRVYPLGCAGDKPLKQELLRSYGATVVTDEDYDTDFTGDTYHHE